MNRSICPITLLLVIAALITAGCTPSAVTPPAQPSSTPPPAPVEPSPTPPVAWEADGFPLSLPGPYFGGNRAYTFIDESRGGREIAVTLWYPAVKPADGGARNAPPDLSAAPYPLVLTEGNTGGMVLQSHLATHGFVMAAIRMPDHDDFTFWDVQMIDWPRDFVFILDQLAAHPPEGLEGVIDTARTGATGYSYGGDISLALGGVRIDPQAYLAHCRQPPPIASNYGGAEWYLQNTCGLAQKWDQFTAFAGEAMTAGADNLWQPVTDPRILAVMPMAPSGTWLYGERGLAAADRPLLMLASTDDEFAPYHDETRFLFENLGSPDKGLITFIGKTHMMVLDPQPKLPIKHFMTAFFGYHLQSRADYQEYFSPEFVAQAGGLHWGIWTPE